ncbi:DUF4249 family protein [Pontibacter akesuensis]|uniref:DUF4249 domain-containing protein n=1 Tax=Pontibacter akesuensis TaxID=388950 RepID=A0A1I7G2I6_9BACT|nr:DUF4249 family protein [Pontibacter akesuensis]GHA59177.1 hypothetical protein GCM10007389_08970 [Pontibacter akesuensis]SFU42675.1 protein of unknown function [Pontibacter akesuensis]
MGKLTVILAFLCSSVLFSCEENITIDLPEGKPELVVEGHIEQDAPPIIILTRTAPVFAEVSLQNLQDSFVHDAQVTVSSGGQSYKLDEVPSTEFSNELKQALSVQFGVRPELLSLGGGFTFYIYTSDELKGETGKSYQLEITHEEARLSATTTIPHLNPIDSLWAGPHPLPEQDSLRILYYRYNDPDTLGNSVRYFTRRNSEPFYAGLFTSVFNDEFINGSTIDYPLDRGEPKGQAAINEDLYSYFGVGDTVTVRWAAIDLPHYRFWYTLENEQNSNGSPIGSPNITRSNIKGGLGIWGGYGVTYHTIIIK